MRDVIDIDRAREQRQARQRTVREPTGDWRDSLIWEQMPRGGERLGQNIANVITILRHHDAWHGVLAFDDFASGVTILREPPWYLDDGPSDSVHLGAWTDEDTTRTAAWLLRTWRLRIGADTVGDAVRVVAHAQAVHPVREYLDSVAWDGTLRIGTWLSAYLGAPINDYTATVGRWWLISAIARVYSPGCQADHALILEGPQGIGKSSTLRILAGQWYTDSSIDIGAKDGYLALRGRWIIELAELEALSRAETARAKAYLSSPVDHYRPPYGREPIAVPRQSVIAGTINHGAYLRDETGGRRWWPVTCGPIDLDGLRRDRDVLWAEAREAYRGGAPWWPTTAEQVAACEAEQADRLESDAWETTIGVWLNRQMGDVTVGQVLSDAIQIDRAKWSQADQRRVGACLTRLAWRRVQRREGARRVWVYQRPKRTVRS